MKILFIGDIFGRTGREALQKHLPNLKAQHKPDVVIVNGENAAHGHGINPKHCKDFYEWGVDVITSGNHIITPKHCKDFYEWGVDVITSGNHIWDQREIIPYIGTDKNLLRPINFPKDTVGNGSVVFQCENGQKISIINALGRVFMQEIDNPFTIVNDVVKKHALGKTVDAIFIDFHTETTAEKMAFGHYFDGRVSAVVGTHTHIPTADAHILENGTAYMTDVGMTGDYNSVIGVQKSTPVDKFVTSMPGPRFEPAKGEATLCGVIIETDPKTGLSQKIKPIRVGGLLNTT